MCRKSSLLLCVFSFIIMLSLMMALAPTSDFDSDGYFDSLITEGVLLLFLIYSVIELPAAQDQIPAAALAIPRVLAHTFRHPPTLS